MIKNYGTMGVIYLNSPEDMRGILAQIYDPQFIYTSYGSLFYCHQGIDLYIDSSTVLGKGILLWGAGFEGELHNFEALLSKLLTALDELEIKYEMDPVEELN